jgi:hypothetical protein
MPDLSAKKNAFVARLIQRTAAVLDDIDNVVAARAEWDAMGYGGGDQPNPPATAITDADLGQFPHLTAAYLNAAVASFVTLRAALDAGHATNFQRLRP